MPLEILYQQPAGKGINGVLTAKGHKVIDLRPPEPPEPPEVGYPALYTSTYVPYRTTGSESHFDNIPSGVPIVYARDYAGGSREIYTVLTAIDNALTVPSYVVMEPGVYTVSRFHEYGPEDFRGWANIRRMVMGLIGAGRTYALVGGVLRTQSETVIRVSPTAIWDSGVDHELHTAMLNVTSSTGPRPTVLYFSGLNSPVPMVLSGITFQGQLQTPFAVYSSATQASFRQNHGAISPILYFGMSIWRSPVGSVFQYLHFQGFGYAFNSAPPGEAGCVNSNYCNGEVRRTKIDGRIAYEIDATQPRSSGGWMTNKERSLRFTDGEEGWTRRSGHAFNTNTHDTSERIYMTNWQVHNIAEVNDAWPGDGTTALPAGFAGAQFEAMTGKIDINQCFFSIARGSHVNLSMPFSGNGGEYFLPAPGWQLLTTRGCRSTDSLYGGLLRIGTPRQPNSTGISPLNNYITLNGVLSAQDYLFNYNNSGVRLLPVFGRNYNATLHKPDTHYVLSSFT